MNKKTTRKSSSAQSDKKIVWGFGFDKMRLDVYAQRKELSADTVDDFTYGLYKGAQFLCTLTIDELDALGRILNGTFELYSCIRNGWTLDEYEHVCQFPHSAKGRRPDRKPQN